MGKKLYPADTLKQARSTLVAWDLIDPSLRLGTLSPDGLSLDIETVGDLKEKILQLENQLIDLRNQRDAACVTIWSKVKRFRTGVKSVYGDDSIEYKMAGGTRLSERKSYRRIRSLKSGTPETSQGE